MSNETHYAYIVDATGRDIPTKTFSLYNASIERRRKLIHSLMDNWGECLAKLPLKFDMMDKDKLNLKELEDFINGTF